MENVYVQQAFGGIRICVLALIVNTVWNMWQSSIKNVRGYIVFAGAAILLFVFNLSAISVVLLAAIAAFIPNYSRRKKP